MKIRSAGRDKAYLHDEKREPSRHHEAMQMQQQREVRAAEHAFEVIAAREPGEDDKDGHERGPCVEPALATFTDELLIERGADHDLPPVSAELWGIPCNRARRSCARPSSKARANQIAVIGTVASEIAESSRPTPRINAKSQPDTASAPRKTTMSITFFALYFSSRSSTVKRTSRAGLEIAKFAVRWMAWKAMTTKSAGVQASARKPI